MNTDTEFKKIYGLIPESLYEDLKKKNKFHSNWDGWLTRAIIKALKDEEEQK